MRCKIMVVVIALFMISQRLINCYVTGDVLWYASQFLSMAQTAIALIFLTCMIPYRKLLLKTLSGVWCAIAVTDCLIYPLWFIESEIASYSHCFQFLFSVIIFFYISIKSYTRIPSDPVMNGYIYQVRAIPDTFQDAILSVIYLHPFGGTGVICAENWYHYRKGRLERTDISQIPVKRCVILRTRKESADDKETLDNLIGKRWTWTTNCVTKLHPFSLKR